MKLLEKLNQIRITRVLIISGLLGLISLFILIEGDMKDVMAEAKEKTSRNIHVVYDDSNSTLASGNDTWCHARYAMQVFAAMLEEKDQLNIYFMSSHYGQNHKEVPDYAIAGTDSMAERVKKVYEMQPTYTSGTPFATVEKAYQDFASHVDGNEENWLVILTDGNFDHMENETIDVNGIYAQYIAEKPNTKIVTVAIGGAIGDSVPDTTEQCLVYRARNSQEVTSEVAELCNRIFQRNLLSKESKIQFDVPVSEIIVLAQGNDVTVEGIKEQKTNNVIVQMTEEDKWKASTNPAVQDAIKVSPLHGQVVTIRPMSGEYIKEGSYDLGITGADDIKVYYKPYVNLQLSLSNDNETIVNGAEVSEGTYQLQYNMVHPQTGERVQSELLGSVNYEVLVNGQAIDRKSGDSIELTPGEYEIQVIGDYLTYQQVETAIQFTVGVRKASIDMQIDKTDLALSTLEDGNHPMSITVKKEGALLSEEEWNQMELPKIVCNNKIGWNVIKGDAVSTFLVYPMYYDKNMYETDTGAVALEITCQYESEGKVSEAKSTESITIKDDLSFWTRFLHWMEKNYWKVLAVIGVILLILGYIPPFKKYLPKSLKRTPTITKKPKGQGKISTEIGSYQKHHITTCIPYKAETGILRFAPMGTRPPVAKLKIKAAGRSGMYIMNYKEYMGKKGITFAGVPIEPEAKGPVKIFAGSDCKVNTDLFVSICIPNQKN